MDAPPPPNPYQAPRSLIEPPAPLPAAGGALASRWRRLGGAFIDGTLLSLAGAPRLLADGGAVQCGVNVGQAAFHPQDLSTRGVISTVLFLALVAVQSFYIATRGQSIGKRLVGARIVTMNGGQPSFLEAVVIRTWGTLLLPLLPFLGGLVALVDVLFIFGSSKRCLHDLVAGTKVVEATPPGHFEPPSPSAP